MKKLILLSIGVTALTLQNASAQYQTNVLFTTANDWSIWAGSGATVAVDTGFSSDNNTINGLGNTGGGTGTGNGSLAITLTTSGSFNEIANSATEAGNQAFLSAIDPGQSGGVGVAYSGTIHLTYSLPASGTYASGTYFQLGVQMQYAPSYYQASFWSATTDLLYTDPNGNEVYQATIPYSITAGAFNGFGFGIMMNSDYTGLAFPIYVDQIESITPVPEPGIMALAGLGALGLAFFARRRRA